MTRDGGILRSESLNDTLVEVLRHYAWRFNLWNVRATSRTDRSPQTFTALDVRRCTGKQRAEGESSMNELSELSKTLHIPFVGRIYASTHHPAMITNSRVLALESSLPAEAGRMRHGQSEYTILASVARLVNMNRRIRAFLTDNPHGTVASVGCGLETTFWRCDNGSVLRFELNPPEITGVQEGLLASSQHHINLPGDMFGYPWIDQVKEYGEWLIIVIVSDVFYCFHEDEVVDFINRLAVLHNVCVVFDSTSSIGVRMSQYHVKRMKNSSLIHFSIDDPRTFVDAFVEGARLIEHTPYYRDIDTRGIGPGARMSMHTSDAFHMVAMSTIQVRQ